MGDDPLFGSRTKIERAKQHLRDLDACMKAFTASDPYPLGSKFDEQTGLHQLYVERLTPIPSMAPAIIGDIVHNLRSALDHLAYRLVFKGTSGVGILTKNGGNPFQHVYFPIFDDVHKYEARKVGQIKGMSKPAIDAIDRIKPYKGGNDTLWRLHRLNNIDKHRLLVVVAAQFQGFYLDTGWLIPNIPIRGQKFVPVEAGAILFSATPQVIKQMGNKVELSLEMAFFEPEIVEGEPIRPTLVQMIDLTENLISSIGAHA